MSAHVGNNSGNYEWYTPPEYIEAARSVLYGIDTDPASSAEANKIVSADVFYTIDNSGLDNDWYGKVWMNPPYSQPAITKFCKKLIEQIDLKNVVEAITLTNNATETKWFNLLSSRCSAICFPTGRIRFLSPDGEKGAPLQGQAFMYFGGDVRGFIDYFDQFGVVFVKEEWV